MDSDNRHRDPEARSSDLEVRSSEVVSSAELAECNCPDDCEVDHDNS
jgi:hypothetical protein